MKTFLPKAILSIFVFIWLGFTNLYAQDIDRVQGDVLIRLAPNVDAELLAERYQRWNGLPTRMSLKKKVSHHLNIWLYHFDYKRIHENRFLNELKSSKLVIEAQFNHLVKNRAVPNDPLFSNQWQYINDGSSGGILDADIDADEAWDITTGGLTALGDTIVVCVIDDGVDVNHEDMAENLWVNHGEIPNNGIDDDGNGFIDDYRGWNSFSGNDDITDGGVGGGHGTPVAGIVGAKGNNGVGVAGVNWDVKLMIVVGGSGDEAEVLMSYDYPLGLRKMYNASGGAEGAFVVSTNASWGIDNGQAADAPLWCAMYDTLGTHGIISCGATANASINVDVDGDLPTACPSDYLIAVTNMDRTDTKVGGAGFGVNSIDLGAFGRDTYTPQVNDGYGPFGGTSGATPHVTGAVALLYSHPCPGFIALAKGDPRRGAELAKQYIMGGVDPNNSLVGLTVTEGRLNIKNSLDLLASECDSEGCYIPFSLTTTDLTLDAAILSWNSGTASDTFNLRYRVVGEATWTEVSLLDTNRYEIANPMQCTDYEFQVQAICNGALTDYSSSFVFESEGCCDPPSGILAEAISESIISVEWNNVALADSFELSFKTMEATDWDSINVNGTMQVLEGLSPCTFYAIRLKTYCPLDNSDDSQIITVRTKGCGACVDATYCPAKANDDSFEFISNVTIADLNSSTGASGGYEDLTSASTALTIGTEYPLSLTPSFSTIQTQQIFEVWFDFNQDGDFEDDFEKAFISERTTTTVSGVVTVPTDAVLGSTRMRVVMKFSSALNEPCGTYDFGEVEDYCVDIVDTDACIAPVFFEAEEVSGSSVSLTWDALDQVDEFLVEYINDNLSDWVATTTNSNSITINELTPCTPHQFRVTAFCDGAAGAVSQVLNISTKDCGTCLDLPYCNSLSEDSEFEWIDSIYVNDMVNGSGNNGGYSYFEGPTTTLEQGMSYPVRLVPGFEDGAFDEFFRIWIDFDQDGVFSGVELVFDEGNVTSAVEGTISIPATALDGETRMRIAMKFDEIPEPCESFDFGEVEDYCITIGEPTEEPCFEPSNLAVTNIMNTSAVLNWTASGAAIGFEIQYRPLGTTEWIGDAGNGTTYNFTGLTACTEYEYQVQTICNVGVSDYTGINTFTTDCNTSLFEIEKYTLTLNAFPNPFQKNTIIQFQSDENTEGQVAIFNVNGQQLGTIAKIGINLGTNTIELNQLERESSGVYIVRILSGKHRGMLRLLKLE